MQKDFEPAYEICVLIEFATNEGSDEPAHIM